MILDIISQFDPQVIYPLAFLMAFVITLFLTPVSRKLAFKVDAVVYPNARGMHKKPMPLAGGVAIVLGFVITIIIFLPFIKGFDIKQITGLLIGSILIMIVGLFDDIHELSAKIKLLFQIVVALIVVYTGTTIDVISWPFAQTGFLQIGGFDKILTVIWIVGVTNAVNLVDGLDGLAAGISSIAALCIMLLSILTANPIPISIVLTASLAGACLGFLPHNFNPATIFMGDTGSNFLGFALSVISIQGLLKGYTAITIIISVLVLGLPIFDTFFAIFRRAIKGQPVMQADRGHLHHRLIDRGYSQKKAVLTLYGVSGIFGIVAILYAIDDVKLAGYVLLLMFGYWIFDNLKIRMKNAKSKNDL